MKIFTLVISCESFCGPLTASVVGSYRAKEAACSACVDKIVEMLKINSAFSTAMYQDENHADLFEESERYALLGDETGAGLSNEQEGRIRKYVREWLMAEPRYYVYSVDGDVAYHFDIMENQLEED